MYSAMRRPALNWEGFRAWREQGSTPSGVEVFSLSGLHGFAELTRGYSC